ncbi:MAG TPA: hypothetical protein VIS76_04435 [Pseudomonadales bacterium]
MSESTALPSARSTVRSQSQFYLYLSLWMWAIAIVGFGPGYVSAWADGTWVRSLAVHIHALVYVGWLALFTWQVTLPSRGRVDSHRRLGRVLAAYAILMVAVGLTVTFSRFADWLAADGLAAAQANLIHPLSDMLIFPVLFGLAIYYRSSPAIHQRLMVVATTMLLVAAVGRMKFLGEHGPPPLLYDLIWLSPIWIAMARDAVRYRMVHPAYALSGLLLAAVPYRTVLVDTAPYREFTTWLATQLG